MDNQHYVESNNLVNSSCHSFYDRQYIVDNTANQFTKNEYSVNVHSKTKKYCIAPASYNDCNDSCECPEGYIYDSQVGCVTPDYYIPITTPPPTPTPTQPILPPSEAPLPKKSCPPGYVYDPYIDRCLSICLRDEYYEPKTGNCIKDCSFSWGKWSECSYEGTKTRDPIIYYQANENGIQCPVRETSNCVIDCSYSWGNWTKCDVKTGKTTRDPIISVKANKPGKQCPAREISNCVVDCNYTWSDWPACDVKTGKHTRKLTINNPNWNGGATCPPRTETKKCDVDCKYNWSDWTDCDMFTGTQTSEINILQEPWHEGKKCPVEKTRTRTCAIDCAYNLINPICNAEDGYIYYTIDMVRDAQNKVCYYDGYYGNQAVANEDLVKSKEKCIEDCEYDLISGHCNRDDGFLYYVINIKKNPTNAKCYYQGMEVQDNTIVKSNETCTLDCSYSTIKPTCKCSDDGYQIITLKDYSPAMSGGKCIINKENVTKYIDDNGTFKSTILKCPVNCKYSSANMISCDNNTTVHHFNDYVAPINGGKCYYKGNEIHVDGNFNANTGQFCQNCEGSWGPCDKECGDGTSTYKITKSAINGGTACTNNNGDTQTCNNHCPVNCKGHWKGWSNCYKDGCEKRNYYIVDVPAQYDGKKCEREDGDYVRRTDGCTKLERVGGYDCYTDP